jgi:tRNA threonylcarbamoyladenosine biosynthesis protein TsaB
MSTDLLAIETSSEACSVALSVGGEMLERHEHAPLRHAELLLPAIRGLLSEAGLALSRLDAIAFGRGPGSFTSLRIGIGVVQGLAWAADLPVVPQSSLAAVAQSAAERAGGAAEHIVVAVDARMQEVFSAPFVTGAGGLVQLAGEERVGPPGQLAGAPADRWIAAGNGFERFAELEAMGRTAVDCLPDLAPRAAMVARLALGWLENNQPLPASQAQPVYVRNKVADKPGGN